MKQQPNSVEVTVEKELDTLNPTRTKSVKKDTGLKEWLVDYVGDKLQPEGDEITVEMIVEVMAGEFPEFLLVVAEENFMRGYAQGMYDMKSDQPTEPADNEQ